MLGVFGDIEGTGIYENADRIVTLPMSLIVAIENVLMPKMAFLLAKGEDQAVKKYIRDSMKFIGALASAMAFGIAAISNILAPIYLGEEFKGTGFFMLILSPIIIFVSFATVLRMQYLIPKGKDISYTISVFAGALINLMVNIMLIPKMGVLGAAIGTILAEFLVMIIQMFFCYKDLEIKKYIIDFVPFFNKNDTFFAVRNRQTKKTLKLSIKIASFFYEKISQK